MKGLQYFVYKHNIYNYILILLLNKKNNRRKKCCDKIYCHQVCRSEIIVVLLKEQYGYFRFYFRRTLRGLRISRLAKIPAIYCDWVRSLRLRKREGGFKNHSLYCAKCRAICFSIIKSLLYGSRLFYGEV